jgi:hypothetical protein
MKINKFILALTIILGLSFKTYGECFTWRTDYGSEQDARINTLKREIDYHKVNLNQLTKIKNYDREVLLARAATRQLLTYKQTEHQRLQNKCFKDRTGPQFEYFR